MWKFSAFQPLFPSFNVLQQSSHRASYKLVDGCSQPATIFVIIQLFPIEFELHVWACISCSHCYVHPYFLYCVCGIVLSSLLLSTSLFPTFRSAVSFRWLPLPHHTAMTDHKLSWVTRDQRSTRSPDAPQENLERLMPTSYLDWRKQYWDELANRRLSWPRLVHPILKRDSWLEPLLTTISAHTRDWITHLNAQH